METTAEEFESIMPINSSGTYSMVRATARSMIGTGTAGSIIILSSVAAAGEEPEPRGAFAEVHHEVAGLLGCPGPSGWLVTPGTCR